jgi:hypothetical protein
MRAGRVMVAVGLVSVGVALAVVSGVAQKAGTGGMVVFKSPT